MSFPIFNDESIYLQYSQLIASDFGKFKFISINNTFGDWKPPLQYWLGSIFIEFFENPLLAGRFVSFFVSLLGFWGIYSFVSRAYNRNTAVFASFLYLLCPPVLMYNNQFVAETYVFSFAANYCAFLLATLQAETKSQRARYVIAAAIFGLATLLSKQSGILYLYLSPLLALIPEAKESGRWSKYVLRLTTVIGIVIVVLLLYRLIIPVEFLLKEKQFTGRWTLAPNELLDAPFEVWRGNAQRIYRFYHSYYTIMAVPLILWFVIQALSNRNRRDIVMSLLFLGSSAVTLLGLRSFNEYIYHTSVVLFLTVVLGRAAKELIERCCEIQQAKKKASVLFVGLALTMLMVGHWVYQDTVMALSPADYIRRSSEWMQANYLSGWPTGFGLQETMDFLRAKQGPGALFVDPQWGNPGTSLLVFQKYYPNITAVTLDQIEVPQVRQLLPKLTHRFVIFSSSTDARRDQWMRVVKESYCDRETRITAEPEQPPIVICEF